MGILRVLSLRVRIVRRRVALFVYCSSLCVLLFLLCLFCVSWYVFSCLPAGILIVVLCVMRVCCCINVVIFVFYLVVAFVVL